MRGGSGSRRRETAIWLVAAPHTTQHAGIHPKSEKIGGDYFSAKKIGRESV